ncbi:MAG: dihydropteroate synthase [Cytophagales bacterium]|nr:dihydropteroate synthase [Marinoscillum sp.]OUX26091.1 MAG: dihydropteroate synthase [Flammeovirgaceae bacterium TMED262]PDH43470.1 MAG: dihydropteroate synthase [Rhodothermaeota bacterium MED-G18]|tara:strand:- start:4722 stop:5528 length:807 start_codon:yes stop_codon:yes gene_type:complete
MIKRSINIRGDLFEFQKPLVMGIVNMTPDSFFDGGNYNNFDLAKIRVDEMVRDGADILDIGGYSTRPGADLIPIEEEWERIKDIIEYTSLKYKNIIISVDTFRSGIARNAFDLGAHIINDISGGNYDKHMFKTVSELKMPYVLMHIRGTPKTMMSKTNYKDLLPDIIDYFKKKIDLLYDLGALDIVIDPGLGFAKDYQQNLDLINNLNLFQIFDLPVLVGISRKSFVKKKYGENKTLEGTLELNEIALNNGANIIRVHDVRENKRLIK